MATGNSWRFTFGIILKSRSATASVHPVPKSFIRIFDLLFFFQRFPLMIKSKADLYSGQINFVFLYALPDGDPADPQQPCSLGLISANLAQRV